MKTQTAADCAGVNWHLWQVWFFLRFPHGDRYKTRKVLYSGKLTPFRSSKHNWTGLKEKMHALASLGFMVGDTSPL